MKSFAMQPEGPFDLDTQTKHFGAWLRAPDLVMAMPLEGTDEAGAVTIAQDPDGTVRGEGDERAWDQALAALSLDVDGSGWPEVGERDPVLGRLQEEHAFLRPVLFHSPYEAATAFVLGHRISMAQTRRMRARLAEQLGHEITIGDQTIHAFPTPRQILDAPDLPGVPTLKQDRLRAIAEAAHQGLLDRARLRALPPDEALSELQQLPGVGPFFAQGILFRGAGATDALTDEPIGRKAIELAYGRPAAEVADTWRPFRMWAMVLLHVWVRSAGGGTRTPTALTTRT